MKSKTEEIKNVKTKYLIRLSAALLLLAFGVPLSVFVQGSLMPPGPPLAGMKSLDQIEARTPVDTLHTPGNNAFLYIINQPGSYYLTTNLNGVAGKDGIEIATNNVALDLNGFGLFGSPGGTYGGIYIPSASLISIRNGFIGGWTNSTQAGIAGYGRNAVFENLVVASNTTGIYCAGGATVKNCLLAGNVGYGVDINGTGSYVLGNDFVGNNAANSSSSASLACFGANNRFEANHVTGSGTLGYGIYLSSIASLTNNILIHNSVEGGGANNYYFNTSQMVGPLITNTFAGIITNSNPWANFSY